LAQTILREFSRRLPGDAFTHKFQALDGDFISVHVIVGLCPESNSDMVTSRRSTVPIPTESNQANISLSRVSIPRFRVTLAARFTPGITTLHRARARPLAVFNDCDLIGQTADLGKTGARAAPFDQKMKYRKWIVHPVPPYLRDRL
jgi:hypothetical protein